MKFIECEISKLDNFFEIYQNSLSSPIDSFLEDHILSSEHFLIEHEDKHIGYFSIHNQELLTQFYIINDFRQLAQEIFFKVKKMQNISSCYVPTSDEFFLSCALDEFATLHKQAYFFKDGKSKEVDPSLTLRIATPSDALDILKHSGDFFDRLDDKIAQQTIFIALKNQEWVGFGIIEEGRILKDYASIGMFTIPSYRRTGIGKNILLLLKLEVYKQNKQPIAGCWYYNHYSKKTLESAGFITDTRLLKINY